MFYAFINVRIWILFNDSISFAIKQWANVHFHQTIKPLRKNVSPKNCFLLVFLNITSFVYLVFFPIINKSSNWNLKVQMGLFLLFFFHSIDVNSHVLRPTFPKFKKSLMTLLMVNIGVILADEIIGLLTILYYFIYYTMQKRINLREESLSYFSFFIDSWLKGFRKYQ